MIKLLEMIAEIKRDRRHYHNLYLNGVKGASIDAAACAIREKALLDAKQAIEKS